MSEARRRLRIHGSASRWRCRLPRGLECNVVRGGLGDDVNNGSSTSPDEPAPAAAAPTNPAASTMDGMMFTRRGRAFTCRVDAHKNARTRFVMEYSRPSYERAFKRVPSHGPVSVFRPFNGGRVVKSLFVMHLCTFTHSPHPRILFPGLATGSLTVCSAHHFISTTLLRGAVATAGTCALSTLAAGSLSHLDFFSSFGSSASAAELHQEWSVSDGGSRHGLTRVHFSAQLEPCLTRKHPTHPKYPLIPPNTRLTRATQPLRAPPVP